MLELLGVVEYVSFWCGLIFGLVRVHQLFLLLHQHFYSQMFIFLAAPRYFVSRLDRGLSLLDASFALCPAIADRFTLVGAMIQIELLDRVFLEG